MLATHSISERTLLLLLPQQGTDAMDVATGGDDGGNVVQFSTFFLRSARKETAPIDGGRKNTGGL
jgi:hypothetical protein